MKEHEVEVKLKKAIVDVVAVPEYETLGEVVEAMEESVILGLINRQNKADITNKARAKHREKTAGKGKRRETALNIVATMLFGDGESGLDKINACFKQTDVEPKDALAALLSSDEVQAAVDAELARE
jgi:hypothetical protein